MEYCIIAWGNSDAKHLAQLQTLQKKAIRNVSNAKYNSHVNPLFLKLKLLNVTDTFNYNLGIFMYKYTYSMVPKSFTNFF